MKTSIKEFLEQDAKKDLLRFSTAGSVDDGKSTLIGRLLHDSKGVYDDQLEYLKGSTNNGEEGEIDYALLTDGLKAEREQGITIDVAYRYFSTPKRKFIIADTPGHEQYTRNMATGASTADLALILIDASQGVLIQSKRHAFISSLLGIPHILIAINKMDLTDYSQEKYEKIIQDFTEFATKLNVKDIHFIPVSALKGDNVVTPSTNMPWYNGPTVLSYLENLYISSDRNLLDLRIPIQLVLRPDSEFRGYASRLASGVIKKGDELVVMSSKKSSKVKSIVSMDGELEKAYAPMSITFTLEDEIDISRGDMLAHKHNVPHVGKYFESMLIWMDEKPMEIDRTYILKHTTQTCKVKIDGLRYKVDINTLSRIESDTLELNEIGRAALGVNRQLYFDPYVRNRETGSFILIDAITNATVAAGMILERESVEPIISNLKSKKDKLTDSATTASKIPLTEREEKYAQKPVTLWITGLHASGKTKIAYELEKMLFDAGHISVVLTGKNLRSGLNKELDFNIHDRAEHLRRAAETAHLMNQHGIISLCAFISPDAALREQLSEIVNKENFLEIFVNTPLEECKNNDKKGLYEQAEKGQLENLAGVSIPYDKPENPALELDMTKLDTKLAAEKIFSLLQSKHIIKS